MPTSQGTLKPFVNTVRSSELYNTVAYPVGGNVTSTTSAMFVATWSAVGVNVITAVYIRSGQILPGMSVSGLGIPAGAVIVGPLNQNGTGTGGLGTYTISKLTNAVSRTTAVVPPEPAGTVITGQAVNQSAPQGPGGIVGPAPGFNCVNIQDLRDYYNLPYPPATPLASPPVIAIVSFGGGVYGQPVTTGQYAGFWKCTDISGNNGAPIQILVSPINGAINAPNADDGGATLENTVDVATVNAFYGGRDTPVYTPPVIILYIAPSSDISEMYRTFYTVLKNPVVCNGKSYLPTVVSCSWGAPEIAWTQKMAFPPNPSIPVDTDPSPEGIAELNEINDLFAEATKNGINICCAAGDIPLTTVNSSVNTFNYAQTLLLQGLGGPGEAGPSPVPQPTVFPLTQAMRDSLPAPQVMFPASSPYVTCVGGSAVYFPNINSGSYSSPAEFAWARSNGGISTVFSIPAYQQQLPGAAAASAAQFLASSLNTANLAKAALGTPNPNGGSVVPNVEDDGITAPNTAITLATQTKDDAYVSTLNAFNSANAALQAAKLVDTNDALMNSLVQMVKNASTALATATENKRLAHIAKDYAEDFVIKTETVSSLLVNAGKIFGAAAASSQAVTDTSQNLLNAQVAAQTAAYNQLVTPSVENTIALQNANMALQDARAAASVSSLSAVTLPAAVPDTTEVANKAVSQAAAAVVAPSLSAHPYLEAMPDTSPLVPVSNDVYNAAFVVASDLPYDPDTTTATPYLLNLVGLNYVSDIADVNGANYNPTTQTTGDNNVRQHLINSVNKADALVEKLYNSNLVDGTDAAIVTAVGQLPATGGYNADALAWKLNVDFDQMLPEAGLKTGTTAANFGARAIDLAKSSASEISSYQSGNCQLVSELVLPCGLASAAASCMAAVYPVSAEEKAADKLANFPYGSTDINGGTDASGTYNGLTAGLINLRNIYSNSTLAARRANTAHKAAQDAKKAFLAWSEANEEVVALQAKATALYNSVPAPSNEQVLAMHASLSRAKAALSAASSVLGDADKEAVITARLVQQSCASTSVYMGNEINLTFDELGNLNAVSNDTLGNAKQGANNDNCPAIKEIADASGNTALTDALVAAQALIQAATNDEYITTNIDTWNYHSVTGRDSSGTETVSIVGTRLLVQDAQFAAAGAAGQVANVAFADATEVVARFTDWHNISRVATNANDAIVAIQVAVDASGNSAKVIALKAAVDSMKLVRDNLVAATTPYNQQSTTSATIATNNVVVLAAKLENLMNVCQASLTAIELAAASLGVVTQQHTINLAYAKVTANAAAAAATSAAILAREDLVLSARRANFSAIALNNLVGEAVCGKAIAGFLTAGGNLVAQTGYGATDASGINQQGVNAFPLPNTVSPSPAGVNGIRPPSVDVTTVLYQGYGGLAFNSGVDGSAQENSNTQPSISSNLTYTTANSDSVYEAVATFAIKAQAVIDSLQGDSSGNSVVATGNNPRSVKYPNVNAVNALFGDSSGNYMNAVTDCLLAAYEAQQWVVASANASFVTFGPNTGLSGQNLVTFTPTLLGVANKLASDADKCLQTVLNAEGAIMYVLSIRPNKVNLHDFDAANFAAAFNANQSAADTYKALKEAAVKHEQNTIIALHQADLANAFSPLSATATTAANQASSLGAMEFRSAPVNSNYASNAALTNAGFPAGGWGSAGITGANLANPNYGPYNGTSTGDAPFPAPDASSSSRPKAPAHQVLQASSQLLQRALSDAALAAAKAGFDASNTATDFNMLMVEVSTVTPSLVDAATTAAQHTLLAAQAANYASSLNNQGSADPPNDLTGIISKLLQDELDAVLEAAAAARANLQAISLGDERYASRKNMLDMWNKAVDAAKEVVQASVNAPTNFQTGPDTEDIIPASLGDLNIMGNDAETSLYSTNGNTALYYDLAGLSDVEKIAYGPSTEGGSESDLQPSLLAKLNAAIYDAYNATTGSPNTSGAYRYISFPVENSAGVVSWVTNVPENVNDTNQAYNKAVYAFQANANVGNAPVAALISAKNAIKAAYDAAVAVAADTGSPIINSFTNNITPTLTDSGKKSVAVAFWNNAVEFSSTLVAANTTPSLSNLYTLMAIVGINFNTVTPETSSAADIIAAANLNAEQAAIIAAWASGDQYTGDYSTLNVPNVALESGGTATGSYTDASGTHTLTGATEWSAYYWSKALMPTGTVAYTTAKKAWDTLLVAVNARLSQGSTLDENAGAATTSKAKSVYSVKIALQSAARAAAAGQLSGKASTSLASSTDTYEDLAAEAAMDAAYSSTANLNMYRCVPDIAMHANADDLPVIFRMNGGNVYVGGTAVAVSMFAGFLGVVQSHSDINYFVNPILYDNYTFPSPLFNDISGSSQVWYSGSVNGSTVPPRIANILPGLTDPTSGLGSGLYNCNVGLGSIKGMNLATLMQVPNPVTEISPSNGDNVLETVYPGTTATLTAYVEPVTAYNPYVSWSCSSPNAVVSQTNGPVISANGSNDMQPYTVYNPLGRDSSGNQVGGSDAFGNPTGLPTPTNGDYSMGSLGDVAIGENPYTGNPCFVFTATVTGITAVPASAPLPVVTVSSTDGTSVYGKYSISVLPAIQVSGVSISAEGEHENPANTTLFLGTTLQLLANVTPLAATNKRVYWWSSNTAIVNVDASGLLTSLATGHATIKATSVNNNISASISVYVPTPITGLSVLPTTITLNPNMAAMPLKNLGLIRAIVQPPEADYKHLTWEVVSSQQAQPAPVGITEVVSLPRNGTILARNANGDITNNTDATVTALSNGTAVLKVSTYGEPYGVYGTYTTMVTVNVVTPVTDIVIDQTDMVINLNPHTAQYDSERSLPESYKVTATLKPAYPSNMNVFWSSSNPKVAVISNNTAAVLNTTVSDPNFGLWQITETITPLSNGTTVIKVSTADGSKSGSTTVVVTTPVTGLSMSAVPVVLNPTKLYTLQATVLPTTATNRAITWESTNTAVATVDSNGVVKAVTSGSCGIRATTVDGDYSALSEISVMTPLVGVQLMVNTPLPIHINDVVQILVVMVPTTASNQQFTWTVTDGIDGNVFTTGPPQNGNIVYLDAVQAGNSVFTVTTADGNKQASINLQVVQW